MFKSTNESGGIGLEVLALALLLVGALSVVGLTATGVAAQEEVHNETLSGITSDETRNVTVDVLWNTSADAANDSATIEVEHVTDATNDTVANTTTATVAADPGNWTTTDLTLEPDQDVEEFRLYVNASTAGTVDDVGVVAESTGAAGGGGGGSNGAIVIGAVVLVVGALLYLRD